MWLYDIIDEVKMSCPTWLDLSEDSLVPPLGTGKAPSLGPVAVMISTAADLKLIQPIMNAASDQEVPFFVSRLITDSKGISVAGPFVGSPYAAMMMESLIARGAKRILVLGWCGSLRPDIQVGDLIVPDLGWWMKGLPDIMPPLIRSRSRRFPIRI